MRIRVLGPVEVERDGALVNVGGPQQRRLLGVLVLHRGHALSTERLVDALWPDGGAPDGASRSMRTYLSRLRSALSDASITSGRAGYALDARDAWLDVEEFDSLLGQAERSAPDRAVGLYDEALALWRGDPFGEYADEWWALSESSRLQERRFSADVGRAEARMTMGHHDRAVPDLQRLTVERPLDERPVALLMQALNATGRRVESLRVGHAFRVRLADEAGLDPSPDLASVESAIATGADMSAVSVGRPLRGYTIHEAIGEGAYGRVYVATQPGTDRQVAIKAIRQDLADATEFVVRFEAEARLVARLEHPHIVPLYDYWREPGAAYLVFRLLTGGTARDSVVSGGPWSLVRVSRLVEEIGGALISAHAAGVVHNDVKSSNVLLDDDGAAYLTDFGIAVAGDDRLDGEAGETGDIRDLASMLWELLTGSPLTSDGSRGSVTTRARVNGVPSLVGRMPSVPDGLDAVLRRATTGTYPSAAEFVLGWRAATGGPAGQPTPITSEERRAADSVRRAAARQLTRTTAAGINPYRGLRPFDEADAMAFYGRDGAVDELVDLVAARELVTVVGSSGSGKSSVVHAGLVPRLRQLGSVIVTMIPGDDPLGALHTALAELSTVPDTGDAGALGGALVGVARALGPTIVIVDQFEECWTRAPAERCDRFLELVARTIDDRSVDVRFVTTVRADLLDRPLEHAGVGQHVGAGSYVLSPMSPAEIDEAVVQPAARVGVTFEDGVVADLVAEAATYPGSLPLLQFTLTELYEHRRDGVIGREALEGIGGMAGAIGRRAEEVFVGLDEGHRSEARELFGRLVTPGRNAPDSRRRALLSELSAGMRTVADEYVAARLLVTDRDPATREPTIEVAHEALLVRWSRLVGWLDEDRRWLAQLHHLSLAARAWDDAGRRGSELYRGVRLEAAIEALDVDGRPVSELERVFVEAGREARDADVTEARRTAGRLRRRLTAVAVALVVALVAGSLAVAQRRSAVDAADSAQAAERAARIEALVARAESMRSSQRDVAALLSIEAHRLADTARTRSALLTTVTGDQGYLDTHNLPADGTSPSIASPFVVRSSGGETVFTPDEPNEAARSGIVLADGATAYVSGLDGRARPYDLDSGVVGDPLPRYADEVEPIDGGIFATDATASLMAHLVPDDITGGTLAGLYDVTSGELATGPIDVGGFAETAALSADGDTLFVSLLADGSVRAFDTASGALRGELAPPDGTDSDVRFGFGVGLSSAGDDTVVIGSAAGVVRIVDTATLDVVTTIRVGSNVTHSLRGVGDGASIVGSGPNGAVRIDLTNGDVVWQVGDEPENCWNLAVVAEADAVFCGDHYGRIDVRDLATGTVRTTLDGQHGNTGTLWPATGGTELVSFANNAPVVSRWRLDGSGPVTRVLTPGWATNSISPDGDMLSVRRPLQDGRRLHLVRDWENKVVDLDTGADIVSLDGLLVPAWTSDGDLGGATVGDRGVVFARYDIDARTLAAGGDIIDAAVAVFVPSMDPGKERVLMPYAGSTSLDAELRAVEDGHHVGPTIPVEDYTFSTISRTGHRIVAATRHGIVLFDGHTGERLGGIPANDLRSAFITIADQLFVGSLGGELVQYDLDTLAPIRSFGGSRGAIQEVYGTTDGSTIAARGGDGIVSLFDVATGTRLGPPLTATPDDQLLMSLANDGTSLAYGGGLHSGIKVVDLDPDVWIDASCRIAGRNLTTEEWATYIGDLAAYTPTCPRFPSAG
jgi:DNA-binding SARP family transcriptional activator/WD40 repeat protein/tRNA A-37 threonylcarbamoyl transferase component Bud32